MNSEVETLLDRASPLPPEDRIAFLTNECPDPRVRAEVEALLRDADQAESCFDAAIQGVAASLQRKQEPAHGDRIGSYRILSLIGSGGMGNVYLAERADGEIQHKVAVKVLRADGHLAGWRERFLNERQLLASLHHPSVVHVIDAGHTDDGRPFLVMEHVEGVPIDRYAAGIEVKEQLRLFLKVCAGVAHAHRHLIIHRDLKPSNILVDATGEAKLLDFGIAKLVNEQTSEVTQPGEQLLTPNYASPEQVRGETQTTATDVYSLGAVLYKMLTGAAPREQIGKEFAAPSESNPEIPPDIDFVVRKALRPEAEERYGSVDEFASDVRAALERRPVEARAGDVWYRMRRHVRRNWIPVAAALLVVGSLSAGLGVAIHERRIAERRFSDVRQLANKLFDIEYETRKLPGGTKASQLIVDTSLQYLIRLEADLRGDPGLALEMGNAYMRVARVQGIPTARNLGQMDQAARNLRIAERFIGAVFTSQPQNRAATLRMAQITHDKMLLARYNGRYDEALVLAGGAAHWLEKFHAGKADKGEAAAILSTYLNVADQYVRAEHYSDALGLCRRATDLINLLERLDYAPDFLWISADVHRRNGDLAQALKELDEAVRLSDPHGAPEVWRTINYSLSLICRGDLLGEENALSLGRPKEAVESLERAFQLADDLAHRDRDDQVSRSRIANAGISMAGILRTSDPRRALHVYDHTLHHLAEIQNNSSFRRFEVTVLAGSSYVLRELGRPAEARQRLNAAFERLSKLKLYPVRNFKLGSEVEDYLRALADHEAGTGNLKGAVEIYQGLLQRVQPAKSTPQTSLNDAVRLSTIYVAASAVHRRAGLVEPARLLESRDRDLWQHWDRALPNSTFVRLHLRPIGSNRHTGNSRS